MQSFPETGPEPSRVVADRELAWPSQATTPHRRPSALRHGLVLVDAFALLIGWTLGWLVAGDGRGGPIIALSTGVGLIAVGTISAFISFSVLDLYRPPINGIRSGALARLIEGMAIATAIVVGWQALVADANLGLAIGAAATALVTTVVARYGFDVWLIAARSNGRFRTPVVVAGAVNETTTLVDFLEINPEAGFRATAIIGERPAVSADSSEIAPWMGGFDKARESVERTGAAGVLVAVNGLPSDVVNELIQDMSSAGVEVHVSSGLAAVSPRRLTTHAVAHEPIVTVRPPSHSTLQQLAKRGVDVVTATLLLVMASPVLAVAAILIKAHDRGPVLFRQVRIGRDGRPFTMIKLRTMEQDAEARLADLRHINERSGPLFKVTNDPRVTPIGGFLRASALDEVPQLLNVLAGTMSMVGPRPALPAETAEFDDDLKRRHLVRPGVTGLWQVEANHKESFDEYRRLDLFYVDNWSVAFDIAVMIDTVPALGRRALRALRRPAPSAPAPVTTPPTVAQPLEAGV